MTDNGLIDLRNQHILIVGGTSGFGLATAKQVIALGAHVTIIGHTPAHLQEALGRLGAGTTGTVLDAADANMLNGFIAKQPPFDHVISTLGGASSGGFLSDTMANITGAIDQKFRVNLQLARIVIPHITSGGSLTFTSGTGGQPATAAGAITGNQAINLMVQGLAIEAAPTVRVNAVAPTWTPTGLWRNTPTHEMATMTASVSASTPLKRVARTDEVAAGFTFLMRNAFITGVVLPIDGGTDAM